MNQPLKDWGKGIPKYTEEDVLKGLELHAFCTNIVAQSMQDEGFTIEGIAVNNTPTQVIANKNGKRYIVIVAGDVFPFEGKISYGMKKQFSDFCKNQNVIPMFASVGLMSSDQGRMAAGLALKYDGYMIKYTGNEDLNNVVFPSVNDENYQAWCVEKIVKAYETGYFSPLYELFADDIQFHSQWVLEPMIGKKALINYYDGKGDSIRKSNTKISGSTVVIVKDYKKSGNVVLMSEPGRICALISQKLRGETNQIFISPKFDENNKLIELSLNDPGLFDYKSLYAFE